MACCDLFIWSPAVGHLSASAFHWEVREPPRTAGFLHTSYTLGRLELKRHNNRCWRRWCHRNPHSFLLGRQKGAATLGDSLAVPQKVKHKVSMWPSNSAPGLCPREGKTYAHTETWTQMFRAVLVIRAKRWKKLLVHQWMKVNKMWSIHKVEHHSAIKGVN